MSSTSLNITARNVDLASAAFYRHGDNTDVGDPEITQRLRDEGLSYLRIYADSMQTSVCLVGTTDEIRSVLSALVDALPVAEAVAS